MSFVHLHVHSHYSILDGMSKVTDLVDKCQRCGMPAMALTDHGNMFGIKEFLDYTKKVNGKLKKAVGEKKDEIGKIEKGDPNDPEVAKLKDTLPQLKEELAALEQKAADYKPFKPIVGIEAYCAHQSRFKEKDTSRGWHLILLAKNKQGYLNLCKLSSLAFIEGFHRHARIDHELLEKYHEGIICSSACLGGEVPQKIMAGDDAGARESILWFKKLFGDDYYLELQRHIMDGVNYDSLVDNQVESGNEEDRTPESVYKRQRQVNAKLLEYAAEYGIKVIATNDAHFVEQEHAEAHDRLICISTNADFNSPTRMRYTKQEWLKSPEEMAQLFEDQPEALANTLEIADKVEVYDIDNPPIMPKFDIPADFGTEEEYRQRITEQELFDEFTRNEKGEVVLSQEDAESKIKKLGGYDRLYRIKLEADYLAKLAWDGAKKRYGDQLTEEQRERITFELHIMKTMGFPGYFLIVQDYIRAAREELGVSVGPGRGSAAGSVVAYCLRITDLDPLKYDLLFERFLNPDRISLPDIDVDFDDDGRGRVLDWVTQRYGYDHVAHIITYGKMAAKSAVADVGRVQGVPLFKVNELKKLIPDRQFPDNIKDEKGKSPKVTLKNCYKYIPELTTELNAPDRDENVSSMLKYASLLEDTNRQIGIHACGVIIGADDLTNIAPMCTIEDKETKGRVVVTQYDGHVVESVGLIKMDFLGLKTLSLIKEALANIKLTTGKEIDIDNIPIDDPKTYELYSAGATIGTFQFESAGMQKYLRELKPTKIEDLIAMNALYRPGPMDYIPQFIRRKQGQEPITYDIPVMEKYLKDTYGITVYQEQVMLLSRLLAGFTRGQADSLRKAMGKKILAMLAELKPKFLNGGIERGHDPEILEKIWRDWEKFASYAFNKSHAACYAWVAYQTGYLKANYPSEYMAANLTRNKDDIKEITKFMDECRNMGIKVLGPDVNASHLHFVPDKDGNIRFGLGGIKGVGEGAVEAIVSEREKNGPYKDVYDFFSRVNLTSCNRKTMESLIYSGAFDELDKYKREQYFGTNAKGESGLELLMRYGQAVQSEKGLSANSLFGDFNCEEVEIQKPKIPESPGWSSFQKLKMEKDLIGIYLTGHPLDDYICEMQLCSQTSTTFNALKEKLNEKIGLCYTVAGMVSGIKKGMTRSNKPYTAFFLEDYEDKIEFRLFGRQDQLFGNQVSEGYFVMITGEVIDRFAQYHRYDSDRSKVVGDLQVNKIELLSDLKARPKSLYVSVPSDNVSQDLISGMQKFFVEVPDCPPSSLHVRLEDPETRQEVNCVSKRSVYINKALIDHLQRIKSGVEGFDYRVEN